MTTRLRFTMPETHAAYRRWCAITKLDETSPEWRAVFEVLDESGLIECDRNPQRSLFDDPSAPLGDSPGARRLRLVVLAGAELSRRTPFDVATATAVAAAMLDVVYAPGQLSGDVEDDLLALCAELPRRVLRVLPGPGDAVAWLLTAELDEMSIERADLANTIMGAALTEARRDEDLAVRVIDRVSGIGIAPLARGGWVLYSTP